MTIQSLQDLFVSELSSIYDAEKQITAALPKMIAAATHPNLKAAFATHLEETKAQVERIEQAAAAHQLDLKQQLCTVMQALIRESDILMKIIKPGPLLDIALISGAQKVEHQEISAYNSLIDMASELGFADAADLLEITLEEEAATEQKLGDFAEEGLEAADAGQAA